MGFLAGLFGGNNTETSAAAPTTQVREAPIPPEADIPLDNAVCYKHFQAMLEGVRSLTQDAVPANDQVMASLAVAQTPGAFKAARNAAFDFGNSCGGASRFA